MGGLGDRLPAAWVPAFLAFLFGLAMGGLLLGAPNSQSAPELTNMERHDLAWGTNRIAQLEEQMVSVNETMAKVQLANDQLRAQNENLLKTPEGLWRQATAAFARFEEDQDTDRLREASACLRELQDGFPGFQGIASAMALGVKVEAHLAIAKALEAWDYGKAKRLAKASTKVIGKDAATRWLTATRLMARQPMNASLDTMCGLAKGNRVAFRKQYDRRWVQLSAEIRKVATSVDEDSYVILPNTPAYPDCAQISFSKRDLANASELRPGDEIAAECRVSDATEYGYDFEFLLADCRLPGGDDARTRSGEEQQDEPLDGGEQVTEEPTGGRRIWDHLKK